MPTRLLKAFWPRIALAAFGLALFINASGFTLAPDATAQQAAEADAPAIPYHFPLPDGWRQEIVTFSLSFAPTLEYNGHGDVRFSPGMFTAGAEDFWTYAFIWWVPLTEISPARLSADMNTYFSGLAKLVTEGQGRTLPPYKADATYFEYHHIDGVSLLGRVNTLDAFATHAPIALNGLVDELVCSEHSRKAVRFAFSPQPFGHAQWEKLKEVTISFACQTP